MSTPALILASQSAARADILRKAGLDFAVEPARVDEESIREGFLAEAAKPRDIADALAELKANRVSQRRPEAFVIGCDQILWCEDQLFNKPESLEAARHQLLALKAKPHVLYTAICVARAGAVVWRQVATPRLTMRDFSTAFLDWYMEAAGETILSSVGAYQLEGIGSQLFSRVEGDYFSVLGLPLLPLQDFLRQNRILTA